MTSLIDIIPNENTHMILGHLDSKQRKMISRTCYLFCFLSKTFPQIPKGYLFDKTIDLSDIYNQTPICISVYHQTENIILSSYTLGMVHIYNNNMQLLCQIEKNINWKISPIDIQVDQSNGNIVIVDLKMHNINIFDKNGYFLH